MILNVTTHDRSNASNGLDVFKNLGWILMLRYQWSVVTGDLFFGEKVCRIWPVNIIGKVFNFKSEGVELFALLHCQISCW